MALLSYAKVDWSTPRVCLPETATGGPSLQMARECFSRWRDGGPVHTPNEWGLMIPAKICGKNVVCGLIPPSSPLAATHTTVLIGATTSSSPSTITVTLPVVPATMTYADYYQQHITPNAFLFSALKVALTSVSVRASTKLLITPRNGCERSKQVAMLVAGIASLMKKTGVVRLSKAEVLIWLTQFYNLHYFYSLLYYVWL